mmetsp:Transcript_19688/g.33840  ORF Transcript_19688/g.33840 Transcript_19688/m.33840 type:complete len:354 (+) Transcript_19688:111-1172(+)
MMIDVCLFVLLLHTTLVTGLASSYTRAIAVYVDDAPQFAVEAATLYESWRVVATSHLSIDLLLFTHPNVKLDHLPGCKPYTHHNFENDCFIVPTELDLEGMYGVESLNYKYLNSIVFLLVPEAQFVKQYDMLLKTDCDTLVTPAFARWFPRLAHVGVGHYAGMRETRANLVQWAGKFGVRHRGLMNLGATWYAEPALLCEVAHAAAQFSIELYNNAFPDRNVTMWPRWWYGVSSMYGQELAVNHLMPEAQATDRIDFPTDRPASINRVYHIHCFQSNKPFSKMAARQGWYTALNTTGWDLTDVRAYSMEMYLRAIGKSSRDTVIQIWPEHEATVHVNYTDLLHSPPYNNLYIA